MVVGYFDFGAIVNKIVKKITNETLTKYTDSANKTLRFSVSERGIKPFCRLEGETAQSVAL